MNKPETIKIDEVEYVRKDSTANSTPIKDGMRYCIVRSGKLGFLLVL